jgi:hypothetical protein
MAISRDMPYFFLVREWRLEKLVSRVDLAMRAAEKALRQQLPIAVHMAGHSPGVIYCQPRISTPIRTKTGLASRTRDERPFYGDERGHWYLIRDRDKIFAKHLDDSIRALGAEVLRSPMASPKANSLCERVIGTIRRECLDWIIPLSEAHLRSILKSWVEHYNRGRPHSSLGPGVPDPPPSWPRSGSWKPAID